MNTLRKMAALAIVVTAAGAAVEASLPEEHARLRRAPLTGAMVCGAVCAVAWAADELERGRKP